MFGGFPSFARAQLRHARAFTLQVAIGCLLASMAHAQTPVSTPGKVPGEFSVSPSGAAIYRIPISVPPGVASMEPKLALTYSSQAGNGIMGLGWSLEGLSAITRCPRTMSTDGVRGSVNHNTDDRYCLDGQRLSNVSGAYGAAGSEYRTEIDTFSKVTAEGVANGSAVNGPESFSVKTKAGLTMTYGATADSRIEAQGKNVVRVWALSRMIDAKGNAIDFTYTEDNPNGEFQLATVSYAGRSVTLTYEDRPDKFVGFEVGSKISQTRRLKGIKTQIDQRQVSQWTVVFSGASSAFSSIPLYLEQCAFDARCIRSADFSYSLSHLGAMNTAKQSAVDDWGFATGRSWVDFNGDGVADFCRVVGGPTNGVNSYVSCTLLTTAGFGSTISFGVIDWGYESDRTWADFNGDGKADFCRRTGGPNNVSSRVACTLSLGDGFGATVSSDVLDWGFDAGRAWVDVNGDGKADFCRVVGGPTNGVNSYVSCTLSTGTGFGATFTSAAIDWGHESGRQWTDFNGDGMTDFCRRTGDVNGVSSKLACTLSSGTSFGATIYSGVLDWGYEAGRQWADFNGDGKADFCRIVGGPANGVNTYASCTLSVGTGFGQTITSPAIDWGYDTDRSWVDVNADGFADFCRRVGGPNLTGSSVTCTLSLGTVFSTTIGSRILDWGLDSGRSWADGNGDGYLDYCRLVGSMNGQSSHVSCEFFTAGSGRIDVFAEPQSGPITVMFKSAANTSVHTRDAGAVLPQIDVGASTQLVSSVRRNNGARSDNETTYTYGGLRAEQVSAQHPGSGRGLLGFRWMKVCEGATSVETYTEYSQNWPTIGQVTKSETRFSGGLLKQSSATYGCHQSNSMAGTAAPSSATTACGNWAPGKVYAPFMLSSVEDSWDLNEMVMPRITTTNTYAGYADQGGSVRQFGDPTAIRVDIEQGGVLKQHKSTTNEYHPANTSAGQWQLGRLKKATVTSTQY